MKKSKRIVSALILVVGLNLISCGNATSVFNESSAIDNTDTVEDSTEATNELTENMNGETVGTDKPVEVETPNPTTTPISTPVSTATPEPTPEATSTPAPTQEPTPEPHTHEYVETITTQPTCVSEGIKTLSCSSCGSTKTEAIPATGEHNWVEETTILHHEALGHVEEVQVQTGTSAGYCTYACSACGAEFNSPSEKTEHCASFVPDPHGMASTIVYDHPGEPIYETQSQWIEDSPAWDEQIVVNYKCSTCGATK